MPIHLPPFQSPDALTTGVFVAIVALVLGCLVAGVAIASRRLGHPRESLRRRVLMAAALSIVWLGLTPQAPFGLFGVTVSAFMLLFTISNLSAVALGLSPVGRLLAAGLPLWALVGFQGFRLPLEIVLHAWYGQGTVPVHITWEGQNFDVIAALTALVAAVWLYRRPTARWVGWLATAIGLGLLLNVIRVAVGASPVGVPWNFGADPTLQLPAHSPFGWIVSVCIAGALAGHIVTLRALTSPSRAEPDVRA